MFTRSLSSYPTKNITSGEEGTSSASRCAPSAGAGRRAHAALVICCRERPGPRFGLVVPPSQCFPPTSVAQAWRTQSCVGLWPPPWLLSACPPAPLQYPPGCYLDGPCGYLDVVQPAQCALSVDEVGGCQLMQGLEGHGRAVPTGADDGGTSCCLCLPAQFPLIHKNGQGLFSYSKQHGLIDEAFRSLIPSL